MESVSIPEPEFDSLKDLLLDMAQERSLETLLALAVERLESRPHVALTRIWLMGPGDVCGTCRMRTECPDQTSCLHLVASAGHSRANPRESWTRLDGDFRRFPLGVRKVGQTALGKPVFIPDIADEPQWIAHPQWAEREGIRGFAAQPLIFRGEVLGVLAVFTLVPARREGHQWLRLIADHLATAIVNTRAFAEVERLRRQLEMENEYLREEVSTAQAFGEMVGASPALANMVRQIELVAPTDATVLVLGESGTGKELVAREIHNRSERRDRPMIKVNCASVPRGQEAPVPPNRRVDPRDRGAGQDRVHGGARRDDHLVATQDVGRHDVNGHGRVLQIAIAELCIDKRSQARGIDEVVLAPEQAEKPAHRGQGEYVRASQALPNRGETFHSRGRRLARELGAVDRADRRSDDELGDHAVVDQRPQHPDLHGPEAAAARQHESGRRGRRIPSRVRNVRGPVRRGRFRR